MARPFRFPHQKSVSVRHRPWFCSPNVILCRSQWPRGLRRGSAATHPLELWVRIPPGPWMFVCCECRVLSGRGLCDELITRPEDSSRVWYVVVCDLQSSWMGDPGVRWTAEQQGKKMIFGEEYKSYSSALCGFLQTEVTSSLLGQNVFLVTLFSHNLKSQLVISFKFLHVARVITPVWCWRFIERWWIVCGPGSVLKSHRRSCSCHRNHTPVLVQLPPEPSCITQKIQILQIMSITFRNPVMSSQGIPFLCCQRIQTPCPSPLHFLFYIRGLFNDAVSSKCFESNDGFICGQWGMEKDAAVT